MKIIIKAKKGCWKISSNDTIFGDSWFSEFKTTEETNLERVDYCGSAKIIHKWFCLATLEKYMIYCSIGSYIVMKRNPRVPGDIPLTVG